MNGIRSGYAFGGDRPILDSTEGFRERIREYQQVLVVAWGRDMFAENVESHKLRGDEEKESLRWLIVSAESYPVLCAS